MKKSFTLIEMIFVIILVGILSISALQSIPDNTLVNNTNFLYNKILEKKANALSFMANMNDVDENRSVCIKFDINWLKNDEKYSKVKFDLSNRVTINSSDETICFDYLGRPHNGTINLENFSNLLHKNVDIKISYQNSDKNITIYPITGYVEIK
jgi:Tfp pilus assembly protein PilE